MTVFKIRLTGEPEYLADKMGYDNYRGSLIVRTTALSLAKNSFCFRGGDSWLSLPGAVRNIKKTGPFKSALKTWTKKNIPRFLE